MTIVTTLVHSYITLARESARARSAGPHRDGRIIVSWVDTEAETYKPVFDFQAIPADVIVGADTVGPHRSRRVADCSSVRAMDKRSCSTSTRN